MTAYYNEIDPYAAEWLRNLIAAGHIAPGDVDTRSIEDVRPDELAGYTQCHFFAGIGGWSLALRLAGWPDDRPVWTGSCPCQPFSAAGKSAGVADERHLWPAWQWLIEQCRPVVIFGEQVEAAIKHDWLDLVQTDLEGLGYAAGSVCLPAASVGAPHARSRLWFVAHHHPRRGEQRSAPLLDGERAAQRHDADGRGTDGGLADRERERLEGHGGNVDDGGEPGRLNADTARPVAESRSTFWSDCVWLPCRDGKARPTQPGLFPLSNGLQQAMDSVFSIQDIGLARVDEYGKSTETNPDEVLRMVRDTFHQETSGEESAARVRGEFHASPILLNFLLDLEAARNRTTDSRSSKKARSEVIDRAVRSVRLNGGTVHSPHRWPAAEQRAGQPATTLYGLSLLLARLSEAYAEAAISAHAASVRIALLRGSGNAIVPQVAEEVIRAYLDTQPH
jgi:DNA (cytosine-5)-methyltransferase 1